MHRNDFHEIFAILKDAQLGSTDSDFLGQGSDIDARVIIIYGP